MSAPVVDACVFLGPSRYGRDGKGLDPGAAAAQAAELGVDVLVAAAAMPPDRDLAAATAHLLEAAASGTLPTRLAVLARVDPWEKDAADVAERALAAGAVGVFAHPWEETFRVNDHALLAPLTAMLAGSGRPLVVEAGWPWLAEPGQLADLARRAPEVPIVATRGGHMNMSGLSGQTAFQALATAPNLSVMTSGVYRQDWLEQVIADLGAERLLYGSLAPALDQRLEILRPTALVDEAARTAVLGGNAVRLFGL